MLAGLGNNHEASPNVGRTCHSVTRYAMIFNIWGKKHERGHPRRPREPAHPGHASPNSNSSSDSNSNSNSNSNL